MKAFLRAFLVLVAILALIGAVAVYTISRRGLSTRTEPSAVEALTATTVRRLATPAAVRERRNPVALTPAVLNDGLQHFADHCAICHANDGSGDTTIGRGLYPRAPDMRAAGTQGLTDGELFWIIEHGVRLTGMPGWGDDSPGSEHVGWVLVHFVRHLPKLTEAEIERMQALNPKTAAQWREAEEERRFLAGEDTPPPAPAPHGHEAPPK